MDPSTLLSNSNNNKSMNYSTSSQQPFAIAQGSLNWSNTDTSFLQPNHLGISRVQRAWDRKPKTPFSHQTKRVGKVWKRAQLSSRPNAGSEERLAKRRKGRRSSPGRSPEGERKPLKKMCLDSGFGLAPRVLAWEGAESPARKIRTRASVGQEELVALPEEEEVDEVIEGEDDVTVEILDEDGTVLEVNPEAGVEDAEWEDEDPVEGVVEDEFNDTMMHLADIIGASEQSGVIQPLQIPAADEEEMAEEELPDDFFEEIPQENQDPALTQLPVFQPAAPVVLPEGFVSPMKPAVPVVKNRRRSLGGPRRRTLPRMFAPSPLSQVMNAEESFHEPAEETRLPSSPSGMQSDAIEMREPLAQCDGSAESDAQWEDVDEVSPPPTTASAQTDLLPRVLDVVDMNEAEDERDATELPSEEEMISSVKAAQSPNSPQHLDHLSTSTRLTSSPIPSIEGHHPRLPLRRSPRRKSSSPRKKSTILPSTEKPHLVAFTPVKGFAQTFNPPQDMTDTAAIPSAEDLEQQLSSSPPERSASAPPEEPQMSPRRPVKPRVSDDTALLQAFLNRAAENKDRGSRRMSAARRESITNRRDSDTVRQALASPAKADVLGELDVNSPSPRKPLASSAGAGATPMGAAMDTSAAFDEVINEAAKAAQHDVDVGDETSVGQRTRRSGRGSRKAAPATPGATPAAPNKIAIKGAASEGVVLKRSEAQEMALLTRNNTRKNKGGAVLPPLRLTRMGSQESGDAANDASMERVEGARGVKWAEQLVEFFQGPTAEVGESSILSDELNAPPAFDKMEVESTSATAGTAAAPPPASETPSKPKIRRLKASRTAGNSTPGKPAPPPMEEEKSKPDTLVQLSADPKSAPAATKRRSRIATPAKGLTNASLLPADLEPVVPAAPAPTSTSAPKATPAAAAAAGKKKVAPISKLPAPTPAQATPASTTTASLGQGKENLMASPAKKKPLAASTTTTKSAVPSAKSFAPKLDFSKSASLAPVVAVGNEEAGAVPGLMSPAKKGARPRSLFPSSVSREGEAEGFNGGGSVGSGGRAEVPGLMSPAKKRTRRAV